jgi:serine/threonine protein kinase
LAIRNKDKAKFAIKTIEKTKLQETPRNLCALAKEIEILRRINHPNVIKLFEVYENELYVHLVLEYINGGELSNHILSKGAYSEKDASLAIKNVLEALAYCHSKSIVHRDLKPENLMVM